MATETNLVGATTRPESAHTSAPDGARALQEAMQHAAVEQAAHIASQQRAAAVAIEQQHIAGALAIEQQRAKIQNRVLDEAVADQKRDQDYEDQLRTMRASTAVPSGGMRGGRVLSRSRPGTPSARNRSCHRQTEVLLVPVRRVSSIMPRPSALSAVRFAPARHAFVGCSGRSRWPPGLGGRCRRRRLCCVCASARPARNLQTTGTRGLSDIGRSV
jgi:hypothetical protein